MNMDTGNYTAGSANALSSGSTVQMQGPRLNFFTVEGANIDNASTESGNVALIIQTVQQLATIHMYEWTDAGSNGTIAMAVYPAGAWTAATLETACQAVVTSVICANGASFTQVL
jgi:hypothetical protein